MTTTRKQYNPKFKARVVIVDARTRKGRNGEANSDALYEEIGRLKVRVGLA
ncbi:MAG: hypothetical protein ACLQU1_28345 [Bryobacteraceae bacterium]